MPDGNLVIEKGFVTLPHTPVPVFMVTVSDLGPVPASLTALILKKYVVPLVRPVKLNVMTFPEKKI